MSPWLLSNPAARDWVHRIYSLLEADGSALVEAVGKARVADNASVSDRLLDWLVDAEWIEPVRYNPSPSQRFFGVGGRAPGHAPRKPSWRQSHTYAQEWRFRAVQHSLGLKAFVSGAA